MNPSQVVAFYGLVVREEFSRSSSSPRGASASRSAWLPLPLTAVHVEVQTFDFCSEVTVTQTYQNRTACTLESEYIFPLDENSAVCGFEAELSGRLLRGVVKEQSAARAEFVQAKSRGQSTMLLEQKQENVFKMSIGNLAPQSECKIRLTYISTLDLEGPANRLVIPAVVAPKYEPRNYFGFMWRDNTFNGPATASVKASTGTGSLSFFQRMTNQYFGGPQAPPSAQPEIAPTPTTVVMKQQRDEAQRLTIKVELLMPSEIVRIASESHPDRIRVQIDPLAPGNVSNEAGRLAAPHRATVTFGMDADGTPSAVAENLGSRDFVLTISQKTYLEARAVLEVDPATGSQAVQLAFCPQNIDLMDASALQTELIFLVDQSGSMRGDGITSVRNCLSIFLRSLPVSCKFNLISFGTSYKKLFNGGARAYSDQSVSDALGYVSRMNADFGGTELFAPLQNCFEAPADPRFPRQVFLLTDGQVTNTQQLIDLVRTQSRGARLFTFGLGPSVDRHLVKSLAAAGRGECEFITGGANATAQQEMNAKVMRNLIRAMQPSLTDVRVEWSVLSGGGANSLIQQCPKEIAPIFPPNRELIYALGTNVAAPPLGSGDVIVDLVVSALSNRPYLPHDGRLQWRIPLNLSRPQHGTLVHKLAARARISELQNATKSNWDESQKRDVIQLALRYQLLSNFTSFIIVDDRQGQHAYESEIAVNAPLELGHYMSRVSCLRSVGAPGGGGPQPQQLDDLLGRAEKLARSSHTFAGKARKKSAGAFWASDQPRLDPSIRGGGPPPPPASVSAAAARPSLAKAMSIAPSSSSWSSASSASRRELSSPSASSTTDDPLFSSLIHLSRLDGSWDLSADLLSLVSRIATAAGRPEEELAATRRITVDAMHQLAVTLALTTNSLATILALWCFRRCFASRQAEWAMLAGKAQGTLRQALGGSIDKVDEITAKIMSMP